MPRPFPPADRRPIRHAPVLAALLAVLVVWLAVMAAALRAGEADDARAGALLALLPPGAGELAAIAAAGAADGVVMRSTVVPGLWAVRGEAEGFAGRLRAAGASAVWPPALLESLSLGGCSWMPTLPPRPPAAVAKLRAGPM